MRQRLFQAIASCLSLTGCAGAPVPVSAPSAAAPLVVYAPAARATAPRASLRAGLAITSAGSRALQQASTPADSVARVSPKDVGTVDVFIIQGTPSLSGLTASTLEALPTGWSKVSVTVTHNLDGSVSTNPVTLGSLTHGTSYTIVSVALGTDPNTHTAAMLADTNLNRSAAQLDVPSSTALESLDPAQAPYLHALDLTGVVQVAASISVLPVQLARVAYNGFVNGGVIAVNNGAIYNASAGATLN